MGIKTLIKQILIFFHIDLTRNLRYDRLTVKIIRSCVDDGSNCIDIGSHKGEILEYFLQQSPTGKHYAFEPIPPLYQELKRKYGHLAEILPFALADTSGTTTFNYVKNAPAYSGIRQRKYAIKSPDIEKISVELRRLDEIIPEGLKVDFIKIDVEGAEFGVLKGAREILRRNRPVILFEFGKGASDYYGTKPEEMFAYICDELGMNIATLHAFIQKDKALTRSSFIDAYNANTDYYFVAYE